MAPTVTRLPSRQSRLSDRRSQPHTRAVARPDSEATYLAWIDVSGLGLNDPANFFEQAGIGMSPGRDFGDNGFMRLNFGCSRVTLEAAVSRLRNAVNQYWDQKNV